MNPVLPERHLAPSKRLLLGVAVLASSFTFAAWPSLHGKAFWVWAGFLPIFGFTLRYVTGSWVRVSAARGLSYRLTLPFCTRLGSIELDAAQIAELRLESNLFSRLLGLWSLSIVSRDGTVHPAFRFFPGMDHLAEDLHRYLERG